MDYFFHYMSLKRYEDILQGGSYSQTGLVPLRRLLTLGLAAKFNCPARMEHGAIYGLTEPMPPAWMKHDYEDGVGTLEFIVRLRPAMHEKMVLLKCHTLRTDSVYVLDHAYHNDAGYDGPDAKNPVAAKVKQSYWKSRIPLRDYHGQYPMGEVVCFDRIPLRRLEVARVYESLWSLCNELRMNVGRELLPPLPPPHKPDYSVLNAYLNG